MGGMGSGRRNQGGKTTTSGCYRLDVRHLQRAGVLIAGHSFGWHWSRNGESVASIGARAEEDRLTLSYSHKSSGDWQAMEYPVRLVWTAYTLGGRRVALLYRGGAGIFACRHCYRLAYACQGEGADDRAMRRAGKIRERLCWQAGIANPDGCKPKGMHWRTFERLTAEHDTFVGVSAGRNRQAACGHGLPREPRGLICFAKWRSSG